MTQCDLVVCPDSAILHIAAALHKQTMALFGPTDPRARINHHPEAVAIWPGKDLKNYPCWYEDPGDGYICWKRLEESTMVYIMLAMINGDPLPHVDDLVTFGDFEFTNEYYQIV